MWGPPWPAGPTRADTIDGPVETEDARAFNAAVRAPAGERQRALEQYAADFPKSRLAESARFQAATAARDPVTRRAAFERFLADFPESRFREPVRFQLALGISEPGERLAALEKFVADFPRGTTSGNAYSQIVSILLRKRPVDEAKLGKVIDAYVQSAADSTIQMGERTIDLRADICNSIADRLMNAELMLDKALELIRQAVARSTEKGPYQNHTIYLTTLGQVQFKRGDYDAAERALKQVVDSPASDATGEAQLYLGKVYEAHGKPDAALEAYLRAAAFTGGPELKAALEKAYAAKHGSLAGLHESIDRVLLARPKPFDSGRYAGKAARVVLAELFTGSECRPCIASDLAFDGLIERFDRKAVAILEYHLHVPGPDPMTQADSIERARYYRVGGTPTVLIDGTDSILSGGLAVDAERKFALYAGKIESRLAQSSPVAIRGLALERAGDSLTVRGEITVDGAGDALDKLSLRLVLAEEVVHYTGGNGIHFHHLVVRKMLGSPEGLPVRPTDGKFAFTRSVNLAELSVELKRYLDAYEAGREGFRWSEKPTAIVREQLALVALVQNDETHEVLQSAFVK
jgi:tetratricopeptide (TPR) repeat protein